MSSQAAVTAAEGAAGKLEGFEQWRTDVERAINRFETERQRCLTLPDTIRIIRCQADNVRELRQDIERLGDQLGNLSGGSVQIGLDFVDELLNCLGIRN